jgi:hypothetical protein
VVFSRCDVGRMIAAVAAIQHQCERVRRRRLCVAVRRSGVVVSFAVIAAIALRRLLSHLFHLSPFIRRRRHFVAFCYCFVMLYYCRVAFRSLPYFNSLLCLSVMDSFSFFFVGLSVCQLRDSAETLFSRYCSSVGLL